MFDMGLDFPSVISGLNTQAYEQSRQSDCWTEFDHSKLSVIIKRRVGFLPVLERISMST